MIKFQEMALQNWKDDNGGLILSFIVVLPPPLLSEFLSMHVCSPRNLGDTWLLAFRPFSSYNHSLRGPQISNLLSTQVSYCALQEEMYSYK